MEPIFLDSFYFVSGDYKTKETYQYIKIEPDGNKDSDQILYINNSENRDKYTRTTIKGETQSLYRPPEID